MTRWILEPGHTAANFRARHMMVTWVHGAFKDVHGTLDFDWDSCLESTFEGEIDTTKLWTGEPARDAHLRSADFLDVENHPTIPFSGRFLERIGDIHFRGEADLTIRGVSGTVPLDISYLGQWQTPFWDGEVNRGEMHRIGFAARTRINRHDYGVSWQDHLPGGGVVVSNWVDLTLDVEAIHEGDLESTGAIRYYREGADAPAGLQICQPA